MPHRPGTARPNRHYYRDDFDQEQDTVRSTYPGEIQPRHDRPTTERRVTRRKAKRNGVNGISSVAVVILILLACAGAYAGYVYRNSHAFRRYAAPILENANVGEAFPNTNAINLMIIGHDYDYNNQDQVIRTHARSDMLMVAHIDFAAHTARLLSIPRDTAAEIPGHGLDKINAAHAMGGPQLAAATIQQNFGITTDHYIVLDFQGFQEAIDKLGGVDCTVDKKMDYDDNWGHLHIHLLPGYQHLTGAEAMGFVRFRHSDSDIVRTQRQQALLASLKEKLVQPQTLLLLPALLDMIDKHIDSDLKDNQRVALARFLHDLPKANVQMTTLPSIEGGELVRTDVAAAAPVVKSIFGVNMPGNVQQLQTAAHHHRRHRHHHRRAEQMASAVSDFRANIYD